MKRRLGSFESAQALTNEHFPFNVVTVLGLENGPRPDVLRQAVEILQRRHPLLGARVARINNHLEFQRDTRLSIPLALVTGSEPQQWREIAERELNTGFDIAVGPLLRLTAILSPAGQITDLIITAQHAVFDAVSGTHLIGEIMGICRDLVAGDSVQGFEPLPLRAAAETYFPKAFSGWRGNWGLMRTALRQIGAELAFRWANRGKPRPPIAATSRCRIFTAELSAAATSALARRCRKERVTLNSALCAAQLLVAMQRLPAQRALRNFVFADLRPYLVPSLAAENLGSYFAMLRITIVDPPREDLWELARLLGRQVHRASRRGEKFTSVRLSRLLMAMILRRRDQRMGEAALAYGGAARLSGDYGETRITRLNAFVSNFVLGPPYTANARRFLGRLWWDMVYLDSDMDADTAKAVAQGVIEALTAATKPK